MELDKIDKSILNMLQVDAKITNTTLAQKINLSPAATLERVKKLEQNKIITNYYTKIDSVKVGFLVEIMLGIHLQRITTENIKLFKTVIDKVSDITTCYQVIGDDFNFILIVKSKDIVTFQNGVIEKLYALSIVDNVKTLHITQLLKNKPIFLQ